MTNSPKGFLLVVNYKMSCSSIPRVLCPSLFWDSLPPNHLVSFFQFLVQMSPPIEKPVLPKINPQPLFCPPLNYPPIFINAGIPFFLVHQSQLPLVNCEMHSSWNRVHNHLLNTQMKAEQDETKNMPVSLIISKLLSPLCKSGFTKAVEMKEYFDGNSFNLCAFSEDWP